MGHSDAPKPTHTAPSAAVPSSHQPPLRVLVLGVSWPMETFVERLVIGLAGVGIEMTVAPMSSLTRPPRAWTDLHRIRWTDAAVPRTPRSVARLAAGRATGSVAQALRPDRILRGNRRSMESLLSERWDVVYVPWLSVLVDHPELLGMPTPLVTSCRGALVTIAPWDPSRLGYRDSLADVFSASTLVHCVSDAILSDAVDLGLDQATARVIRPAVDPAAFTPRASPSLGGPIRAVGTGSLIWRKDYEHALSALRRSIDDGADMQLDLIGDGPDRAHLQFTIDDLDLGNRVRLLGRRQAADVAEELRQADIFLHTSCSEGISNAVLEAMATGLPVVTTDAGGMREAVRDGVDGFVVPVRDSSATAAALTRLAGDPELRARVGASARRRVEEKFRLDQQVNDFVALLREAAGR